MKLGAADLLLHLRGGLRCPVEGVEGVHGEGAELLDGADLEQHPLVGQHGHAGGGGADDLLGGEAGGLPVGVLAGGALLGRAFLAGLPAFSTALAGEQVDVVFVGRHVVSSTIDPPRKGRWTKCPASIVGGLGYGGKVS